MIAEEMETILPLPDVMFHVFKFLNVTLVYKFLFVSPDCKWMWENREKMLHMLRKRITDRDTAGLSLSVIINLCRYKRIRNRIYHCGEHNAFLTGDKGYSVPITYDHPDLPAITGEIKEHPELGGIVECIYTKVARVIAGSWSKLGSLLCLHATGKVYETLFDGDKVLTTTSLPVEGIIQMICFYNWSVHVLLDNQGQVYARDYEGKITKMDNIHYITRMARDLHHCYLVDGDNNYHRYHPTWEADGADLMPNNKTITSQNTVELSLCNDRLTARTPSAIIPFPQKIRAIKDCYPPRGWSTLVVMITEEGKICSFSTIQEGAITPTNTIEGIFSPTSSLVEELGQTLRLEWGTTALIG